jgi:hypothetical protein
MARRWAISEAAILWGVCALCGVVSVVCIALLVIGCGPSYTADDTTANTIAARMEARVLDLCASDDAGTCTPSRVRAFTLLAACANDRELVVHSAPVPDGGALLSCRPQ